MTWIDLDSSDSLLFPSLSLLRGHFSFPLLASPPFVDSDLSAPKKCRARFGLDQQNNWCGPCRCVSGVLAGTLEQVTAGKLLHWQLFPVSASRKPLPLSFSTRHPLCYQSAAFATVKLGHANRHNAFLCGGALE